MLYSFEIFSDVMKDEGNYVTRNENKAYQTGISNITNIDKIDGSKNTDNINCVKKNNVDNRNSWRAKRKAKHGMQRCIGKLMKDIYVWFL